MVEREESPSERQGPTTACLSEGFILWSFVQSKAALCTLETVEELAVCPAVSIWTWSKLKWFMDSLDSIQQPLDLTAVQLENGGCFDAWFGVSHDRERFRWFR